MLSGGLIRGYHELNRGGTVKKSKNLGKKSKLFGGSWFCPSYFRLSIAIAYHDFRIFGFARAEEKAYYFKSHSMVNLDFPFLNVCSITTYCAGGRASIKEACYCFRRGITDSEFTRDARL